MRQSKNSRVGIRVLFQGIDSLHHYYIVLPAYIEALNEDIKVDVLVPDLLEIPKAYCFALKRFAKLIPLAPSLQSILVCQKIKSLAGSIARARESNYRVIHFNEPFIESTKVIMSNMSKTPKLLTFHDPNIVNYDRRKIAELRYVIEKVASIIVPSFWLKSLFHEKLGLKPLVIHHCVDPALFNPFIKKSLAKNLLRMGTIPKIVVWNGRLDPDKDPATMINVVELLAKECKEVGFILKYRANYYCPNYTMKIFERLKKLKRSLKNRLKMFNQVPLHKLPILYRAADLYFTTSPLESFSMATVEAMACGLPVIIPNSSALPEVVGDAGLYCKVGDARGFAESILRVLSEEKLMRYLSYKSLKRVLHNFHPIKISNQYASLYEEIADRNGR
jgi:glycosyltransferase involved in cell wall biosynthesis